MSSVLRLIPIAILSVPAAAESSDDCPHCGEVLVLHQPCVESPERLLGTCPGCMGWFLLDGLRGGAVTVLLPGDAKTRLVTNG